MKGIFRQVDTKRTIDILCIRKKTLALHVSNSISIEMYSEWENNGIIMGRFQLKLWPISPLKGQSKLNSPDRLFPLYWLNLLLISIDRSGHWLRLSTMELDFRNLCVEVYKKLILNNVSGLACPGELLAVMGPSGKRFFFLFNTHYNYFIQFVKSSSNFLTLHAIRFTVESFSFVGSMFMGSKISLVMLSG